MNIINEEEYYSNKNMTNMLLSFPRSGNSWFRYCIELLTGKPTVGYYTSRHGLDRPIYQMVDTLDVDVKEMPIITKRHGHVEGDFDITNKQHVIMLIRNPIECLIRHSRGKNTENFLSLLNKNLDFYNRFDGKKIIGYYEDMLKDPRKFFTEMLEFLEMDDRKLDCLMDQYEMHRGKSLQVYSKTQGVSDTKGDLNNFSFHIDTLKQEDRVQLSKKVNILRDKYINILGRYEI